MDFLDRWDVVFLFVATYVAVISLVRLMRNRRDELVTQVRQQIELERERRAAEARAADRKRRKENRDAA